MCSNQKATNEKYRDKFDETTWGQIDYLTDNDRWFVPKNCGKMIWVDFGAENNGDGSYERPFNDYNDALAAISIGGK